MLFEARLKFKWYAATSTFSFRKRFFFPQSKTNVMIAYSRLEPQSRYGTILLRVTLCPRNGSAVRSTNYLELEVNYPQNGSAVLCTSYLELELIWPQNGNAVLSTNYLELELTCPQNGSAVLSTSHLELEVTCSQNGSVVLKHLGTFAKVKKKTATKNETAVR